VDFKYEDNRWYRIYSDGWIEQGGIDRKNFLIPFTTKIFTFQLTPIHNGFSRNGTVTRATNVKLTGFSLSDDSFEPYVPTKHYSYYATGY